MKGEEVRCFMAVCQVSLAGHEPCEQLRGPELVCKLVQTDSSVPLNLVIILPEPESQSHDTNKLLYIFEKDHQRFHKLSHVAVVKAKPDCFYTCNFLHVLLNGGSDVDTDLLSQKLSSLVTQEPF